MFSILPEYRKVNVYDDMLELWFTQDAEYYLSFMCLFYGSCVTSTISSFFSSVRSLISPGSNTGCIVMYQDNPILDDNSKLKLACHVW